MMESKGEAENADIKPRERGREREHVCVCVCCVCVREREREERERDKEKASHNITYKEMAARNDKSPRARREKEQHHNRCNRK